MRKAIVFLMAVAALAVCVSADAAPAVAPVAAAAPCLTFKPADLAALRVVPRGPEDFLARGRALREKRVDGLAIREFSRAIALNPTAEAYAERAYTYSLIGDHDRAVRDYGRAIEAAPEDACLLNDRGISHEEAGRLGLAVRDYSAAISVDPALVPALTNRGHVFVQLGRLPAALRDYDAAVRADPSDVQARDERRAVLDLVG